MSFPKLNDFIGNRIGSMQYKRISLIHSIKNSLARNIITRSCINNNIALNNTLQSTHKINLNHQSTLKLTQSPFKYQQKMPTYFQFSTQDMYKLLEHLFNKKQHDISDRNFIRRILLRYFPQDLICTGERDFVNQLQFLKLRKGQKKIINIIQSQNNPQSHDNQKNTKYIQKQKQSRKFYFILKGKIKFYTNDFEFKKVTGQYFGELQILGNEYIVQIEAKTDVMLLTLSEDAFRINLSQYFISKFNEIRKKLTLIEPILNLTSYYNQLRIMQLLYEKDYKTGDKIVQKGQQIKEIIFLNNTQMSFSQDKTLNQFKAIGLIQFVTMQSPIIKQTIYCMENKTIYSIKIYDLKQFIDKERVFNYLSSKFFNLSSLSTSKLVASKLNSNQLTENKSQNNNRNKETSPMKLQNFVNIKKVRFLGNKRRVLTQPNQSILVNSSSPKSTKSINNKLHQNKYPQYATSFVFIKQNSLLGSINNSTKIKQVKSNRLRSIRVYSQEVSKHKQMREYMLRTNNSFKKKRWLDQMETIQYFNLSNSSQRNKQSIIYNQQKKDKLKYETPIKKINKIQQIE